MLYCDTRGWDEMTEEEQQECYDSSYNDSSDSDSGDESGGTK